MKKTNYLDKVFGRLVVVDTNFEGKMVKVLCACKNTKLINFDSLRNRGTKSCGCLRKEVMSNLYTKHGFTKNAFPSRPYRIFQNMKTRCSNPKAINYKWYGGKNIKCEWVSFEDFWVDMGGGYKEGLSIDRKNNNGNYCKENCRWVAVKAQQRNTSKNVSYKGELIVDACKRLGGSPGLINKRIHTMGWTVEKAFTTPAGKIGTNQFTKI